MSEVSVIVSNNTDKAIQVQIQNGGEIQERQEVPPNTPAQPVTFTPSTSGGTVKAGIPVIGVEIG